jgi:hypothetical protein
MLIKQTALLLLIAGVIFAGLEGKRVLRVHIGMLSHIQLFISAIRLVVDSPCMALSAQFSFSFSFTSDNSTN